MKFLDKAIYLSFVFTILTYLYSLNFNSYFLVLLTFFSILKFIKVKKISVYHYYLIPLLFFAIRLASLSYSENLKNGLNAVERSLPLLVCPFIIAVNLELLNRKLLFRILNVSVIVGVIVIFVKQAYFFYDAEIESIWWLDWKYNYNFLSNQINIRANYLSVVIAINIFYLVSLKFSVWRLFWVFVEIVVILLLSSRAVILFVFIAIFIYILRIAYLKFSYKGLLVSFVFFIAFSALVFEMVPVHKQRFIRSFQELTTDNHNTVKVGGINSRIGTFYSSLELIMANPILGVGIGDVRAEIVDTHRRRNFIDGVKHSLDSHNQFLQSFVGTGILGFLLTVLLVLAPLFKAIGERTFLDIAISSLFAYMFFFESFIETQKGIVLFCIVTLIVFSEHDFNYTKLGTWKYFGLKTLIFPRPLK